MNEVIQFPAMRSAAQPAGRAQPGSESFGPTRDLGWLLYAIIEIEIAQASLANAINRLPPGVGRDHLQGEVTRLKRQMRLARDAMEELVRMCDGGQNALQRV